MKSAVLMMLLAALFAMQLASAATVIVLNETEPQIYSLQSVLVSGDLGANSLSVIGGGEVLSGSLVKVYLFGPSRDLLIKGLSVNGRSRSLSFDEQGYYFLAEKGDFGFSADMEIRTIGQVRLHVPGPMNELTFKLQHGYAIDGDRFGVKDEDVIIQRSEKVAMLSNGNFRFSYGLRNEFTYDIAFRAFGKSLGSYVLPLRNGETVTSVSGALNWDQQGSQLLLDLADSQAEVIVRGFFSSASLRVPLSEDTHHVLIESDPEKKLTVSTAAKEIDLQEIPLVPQYGNARAFLADANDNFEVSVQKLGLLPSLAAAVRSATNVVAVTPKGSIIGEMIYNYANTGVDYLEVDTPGQPLYASTASSPVKLTKEEKLLLAFPKDEYGTLDLVYFTTRHSILPVDLISVPLARTELPITTMTTQIHLPGDVFVLETFGAQGGSELPDLWTVVVLVAILAFLGYLLVNDRRFIAAYVLLATSLLILDGRLLLLLIAGTIYLKVRDRLSAGVLKWLLAGAGILLVIVLVVGGLISLLGGLGGTQYAASGVYESSADSGIMASAPAPFFEGMRKIGADEEAAITVPTREGVLPVKLEIPELGKQVTVTNDLVTKENPVSLHVLVVASWLKYLFVVAAVLAGLFCRREYRARNR